MKINIKLVVTVLALSLSTLGIVNAQKKSLFNGENLDGWKIY